MHDPLEFTISALAVWRGSYLLVFERGPWGLFEKCREAAQGSVVGEALGCIYCTSVWVAVPVAGVDWHGVDPFLGTILALSAGAIALHECLEALKAVGVTPAPPTTDPE